jgi:hypothetical protein
MKQGLSGSYIKTTVIAVVIALLAGLPPVQAATFQLAKGTEVKVKLQSETAVSSKTAAEGDTVFVTLAEPIMLGDQTLVAEGALGTAVVSKVKKAGAPGNPGEIEIQFQTLGTRGAFRTADGSPIKLTGSEYRKGKGKKLLAFITIVGIFLIKGGQGEIAPGETFTAQVAETIVLSNE